MLLSHKNRGRPKKVKERTIDDVITDIKALMDQPVAYEQLCYFSRKDVPYFIDEDNINKLLQAKDERRVQKVNDALAEVEKSEQTQALYEILLFQQTTNKLKHLPREYSYMTQDKRSFDPLLCGEECYEVQKMEENDYFSLEEQLVVT